MTEPLFFIKSPDSFHQTTYQSREVFALADDWAEVRTRLPAFVSADLGIPEPVDQYRAFAAPYGYEATRPDDPLTLLPEIYDQLQQATDEHRRYVQQHAADLFDHLFAKELTRMQHWWDEGYFPRHDSVQIHGRRYDVYNHRRTLSFTGDVTSYGVRNMRTGHMEQWYQAELDTAPAIDPHANTYVPYDEAVSVTILPSMANEPYVDRTLVNAHIEALRSSVAPWVIETYAAGFQTQPSQLQRVRAGMGRMYVLLANQAL